MHAYLSYHNLGYALISMVRNISTMGTWPYVTTMSGNINVSIRSYKDGGTNAAYMDTRIFFP
jgi:hypothetical protein